MCKNFQSDIGKHNGSWEISEQGAFPVNDLAGRTSAVTLVINAYVPTGSNHHPATPGVVFGGGLILAVPLVGGVQHSPHSNHQDLLLLALWNDLEPLATRYLGYVGPPGSSPFSSRARTTQIGVVRLTNGAASPAYTGTAPGRSQAIVTSLATRLVAAVRPATRRWGPALPSQQSTSRSSEVNLSVISGRPRSTSRSSEVNLAVIPGRPRSTSRSGAVVVGRPRGRLQSTPPTAPLYPPPLPPPSILPLARVLPGRRSSSSGRSLAEDWVCRFPPRHRCVTFPPSSTPSPTYMHPQTWPLTPHNTHSVDFNPVRGFLRPMTPVPSTGAMAWSDTSGFAGTAQPTRTPSLYMAVPGLAATSLYLVTTVLLLTNPTAQGSCTCSCSYGCIPSLGTSIPCAVTPKGLHSSPSERVLWSHKRKNVFLL